MPAPTDVVIGRFGAESLDPRGLEKVKVHISNELKNKGKSATKNRHGIELTETQWVNAEILPEAGLSPAFSLVTPPSINQGSDGSCVSFATAYCLLSVYWYYKLLASSYSNSVNVFSPEFLHAQIKFGDCFSGSSMLISMPYIQNTGCTLWVTYPYSYSDGTCTHPPSPSDLVECAQFRIGGYAQVLANDVAGFKSILSQNAAIIFQTNMDSNWYNCGPGFILSDATKGTGYGNHCMAIVGYDDSKHAYKVMNSFGVGWGDAGFSYIDYDYYPVCCTQGMYITSAIPPSNTNPIANAGFDSSAPVNVQMVLDGTGSRDPDGSIASYLWEQTSGTSTAITNSTSPVASITPTTAGARTFKLTVTDNSSATAVDEVIKTSVAAVSDSFVLSYAPLTQMGKKFFVLSWNLTSSDAIAAATIETHIGSQSFYSSYYQISTGLYSASGSYQTGVLTKRKVYYYRIKIVKANGTIAYSNELIITA